MHYFKVFTRRDYCYINIRVYNISFSSLPASSKDSVPVYNACLAERACSCLSNIYLSWYFASLIVESQFSLYKQSITISTLYYNAEACLLFTCCIYH